MEQGLRLRFLDMALDRTARGSSESLRLDGVAFLARSDDPRAVTELQRVFGWTANSTQLRLAALRGLSSRADAGVLRLLRDTAATELDPSVRAQAESAAARVAELLAAGE
jgi:hypothetical protein